jgi:hypothetical protein
VILECPPIQKGDMKNKQASVLGLERIKPDAARKEQHFRKYTRGAFTDCFICTSHDHEIVD